MNSCERKKKNFFSLVRLSTSFGITTGPADAVTRDVHFEERLRGSLFMRK